MDHGLLSTDPYQTRILTSLSADDLLNVRAVSHVFQESAEATAAQLLREQTTSLSSPRGTEKKQGNVRWLLALSELHAPPRLVAAGGYNSVWNGHAPVYQTDDAHGCERSVEVACSVQSIHFPDRWRRSLPQMLLPRADLALVRDEPCKLYALGGRHGDERHASVEMLDILQWRLSETAWTLLPPMMHRRSGLAAATSSGLLVAVGGRSGRERVLKEAEALQLAEQGGKWTPLAPMQEAREYAAAAARDTELWVLGGGEFEGSKSVEVLDLASGFWRPGPTMEAARFGPSAVWHEGRIIVVGGSARFGMRQLTSMEILDPREGLWQFHALVAPPSKRLGTSLWGCSAVAHGSSLFLCGGAYRESEESQDWIFHVDVRTMSVETLPIHSADGHCSHGHYLRLQVPRWCGGACLI